MRHKTERHQAAAERTVNDIRRKTRKRYPPETTGQEQGLTRS